MSDQDYLFSEEKVNKELQDPLKASIIKIQFMAIKFQLEYSKNERGQEQKDLPMLSDTFYIPERVYFSMNFFDYPLYKTDSITYDDSSTLQQKIKDNE